LIVALVVDASVGLKWVLQEQDSHLAEALVGIEPDLLVPDFWLHEATNILWLQVHRKLFTTDEAREGLALLRAQVEPTPTAHMRLHDLALDIGMAIDHSTYDTLYLAFAVAMGASAVVTADASFVQSIRTHPDPTLSAMVLSLDAWASWRDGVASPAN
jgi:predicted nucleic acid-binding protein